MNGLLNLAECYGYLGQPGRGLDAGAEALAWGEALSDWTDIKDAHSCTGRLATLSGDTLEAEKRFLAADRIAVHEEPAGDHLYSFGGIWWADFLVLTGRPDPAGVLIRDNKHICQRNSWNSDVAHCDLVMGRMALASGNAVVAGRSLTRAAAVFRDGDLLTDLTTALAELAEHARVSGDLDGAERYASEAITIAAPRGLVLAQCAALAVRSRICVIRTTDGNLDALYSGRDAADAALRLAVRHQLAWHELEALRAHALLDQAEGIDHGWAAKADALHARLVPPGLDPDPLGTVERLVAEQKASEAAEESED